MRFVDGRGDLQTYVTLYDTKKMQDKFVEVCRKFVNRQIQIDNIINEVCSA